jgi:hypothetical protein
MAKSALKRTGPGRPRGSRDEPRVEFSTSVGERTLQVIDLIGGVEGRGRVVDKLVGFVDLIARAAAHEIADLSQKKASPAAPHQPPPAEPVRPGE